MKEHDFTLPTLPDPQDIYAPVAYPPPPATPRSVVYLAGPISALGSWSAAIRKAVEASAIEGLLVAEGWLVLNPYSSVHSRTNWQVEREVWIQAGLDKLHWMAKSKAKKMIDQAVICRLPGWEWSGGAVAESNLAGKLGIDLAAWVWEDEEQNRGEMRLEASVGEPLGTL